MINITEHCIHQKATAREAFGKMNQVAQIPILFVIDDNNRCIGSVTDGDLRRFILREKSLDTNIMEVANLHFAYLDEENNSIDRINSVRPKIHVPILNKDKQILKVINFEKGESYLPCSALIMAGGKGTRLMPLTANIPKPLLKVGERTILDINISRLVQKGIQNIYVSVHHLKEQIIDFIEAQGYDTHVHYVEEAVPSGTLGAIKYMGDWKYDHLLVMNSDLLTNINFESFLEDNIEWNALMSVVSIPYKVAIPYAVMEVQDGYIQALSEKPTLTFQSNGGIYMVHKKALQYYDGRIPFNAPDLIETLIAHNQKVRNYVFSDYWLDIGKHADFERAQEDVKNLQW